jgi:nicotinate-nucleotide pyrophosphorylase (carboxylating)
MADEQQAIDFLLEHALKEDLGAEGDVTSAALFGPADHASAVIRSKADGILSGIYLLGPLYSKLSAGINVTPCIPDGGALEPGAEIARLHGPIVPILAGERTALNFLQRLSGIATATARMAAAISHTRARLLDTRKTTSLLRLLEKKAVVHGGGANHRFGLFDMVLIKNTHVDACGGPSAAVKKARGSPRSQGLLIEVEVRTVEEFLDAVSAGPDRIMFDNMTVNDIKSCVSVARSRSLAVELEASGNVTLETIAAIAETGVDFISCGAITHSAGSLDIHLEILHAPRGRS